MGPNTLKRNSLSALVIILLVAVSLTVPIGCENPLVVEVEERVAKAVTPASVKSIFPGDGERDVASNTEIISVTFSKPIDERTVTSSTFYVAPVGDGGDLGSVIAGTRSVQNESISFDPSQNLAFGQTYAIVATAGIRDIDGNAIAEEIRSVFTTGLAPDEVPPDSPSIEINAGAAWTTSRSVSLTLGANDDRGVSAMNISNSNTFSDANWTSFESTYAWELPEEDSTRTIYVKFRDSAGNTSDTASASIGVDTEAPVVESFAVDGGKRATKEQEVALGVGGEDVAGGSGVSGYQTRMAGEQWPENWTELEGGTSVLQTGVPLPEGIVSDDSVTFEARITDVAGNISAVVSATIVYDLSRPSLLSASPAENETGVPFDAGVVHTYFSEPMDVGTFTPDSFYVESSTGVLPSTGYDFGVHDEIPNSRITLTGLSLDPNADYFVTVSADVTDVAGNPLGTEQSWFFRTGEASDETAPTGSVSIAALLGAAGPDNTFAELPSGKWATDWSELQLAFSAVDDYNDVYGMNVWGEGNLSPFEDPAGWALYNTDVPWTIGTTERTYNLWFRLQDSRGNRTPDPPGHFAVIYDASPPTVSSVGIADASIGGSGNEHVNSEDGLVELFIVAEDIGASSNPGSGLDRIRMSNDGTYDQTDEDWRAFAPLISEWAVDTTSEGQKTLYLQIEDYLGHTTSYEYVYYYDVTPPTISFDLDPDSPTSDVLETNSAAVQTGTYTDNVTGTLVGGAADMEYLWEQVGGEGTVAFSDPSAQEPEVSADEDGTYLLSVTVVDFALNSANATIPFIWDTVPPSDLGPVVVESGAFDNSGFSTSSWSAADGADYYNVVVEKDADGSLILDSNTSQIAFTPASKLPEGALSITVTPYDNAGNSGQGSTVSVHVDTVAPQITNNGQAFLKKEQFTISYGENTAGSEGQVTEDGSGVAGYAWTQTAAPDGGTITFGSPDQATTSIEADVHGNYGISLTVTDNAGNQATADFSLNWDIQAPAEPEVTGIEHTPEQQPTWSWTSGGGGNGTFRHRLVYPGLDPEPWSAETTETSWTPPSPLVADPTDADGDGLGDEPDSHTYRLEVQERDEVGNWSAAGFRDIWVDANYTAPPEVTVEGPLRRSQTDITWNWTSGAAQGVGATFRWRINGGDWQPSDSGTTQETFTYSATTTSGQDETFTIEVEEFNENSVPADWTGKLGSSTVRVDLQGPAAPTVALESDDPTTDTTPTWRWSSNAGSEGTGIYRHSYDRATWSSQTTSTVYTAAAALVDDEHRLYVAEQDDLGNWGESGQASVVIDTTPPSISSVQINSGAGYTADEAITVSVQADSTAVDMRFYDFSSGQWEDWQSYAAESSRTVPSGEGTKVVRVQVRDALGNSATGEGSIELDQTPPANGSVSINGGDFYTPSLDAYLTLGATDNLATQDELEVQYYHDDGNEYQGNYPDDWEPFRTSLFADVNFSTRSGYKYVFVRFRDPAGNVSDWYSDYIYLQRPSPSYTLMGAYSGGRTYVYFNGVSEPSGSSTTYYYTYFTTNPDFDPNADTDGNGEPDGLDALAAGDGRLSRAGSTPTSSTSYDYVSGIPEGRLVYFWMRAYNDDSGGWGPFSTASVVGFSSNVTVIYNSGEPADVDRADAIKALLEDKTLASSRDYVFGTMPDMSVTLLPESMISNSYATSNRVYGDPIIVTSDATVQSRSDSSLDGRIRNIVSSLRPVIAMGNNGGHFLYRVQYNFSAWKLTGQSPVDIDSGNTMGISGKTTATTRPAFSSDSVWYEPLSHRDLDSDMSSIFTTALFTSSVYRRGVYISSGSNPTGGAIYAGDPDWSSHFPVVRQGRYMLFGFTEVPDTLSPFTFLYRYALPGTMGKLFFVNLVDRMSDF